MNIKNKKVLVVGMARSGIPTVKALNKLGAIITVNDVKNANELKDILKEIDNLYDDHILGEHPEKIEEFDLIILSPGVPPYLKFLEKARKYNIPIMGELELAYRLSKGKFIAITGTNGKTTTTALTGEIFKNADINSFVVGNIGLAAISKALDTTDESVLVTEVSSFQLETINKFRPRIAAILNITPDHLNRHKTMENYIYAKANIFSNQTEEDVLILNYDNEITQKLSRNTRSKIIYFSRKFILDEGVYVENDKIFIKLKGCKREVCDIKNINIPGNHNLENTLAAIAISYTFGIDINTIKNTVKEFTGVQHRIEFVDELEGVKFYNDSKGTNPDAAIKAIDALSPPLVLIAGGMDKGSDFKDFINAFSNKVKVAFVFGETSKLIKNTGKELGFHNINVVNDMEEAVKGAYKDADHGDTVLLSPACASWDMYDSFEHRGDHFKECVNKLRRS